MNPKYYDIKPDDKYEYYNPKTISNEYKYYTPKPSHRDATMKVNKNGVTFTETEAELISPKLFLVHLKETVISCDLEARLALVLLSKVVTDTVELYEVNFAGLAPVVTSTHKDVMVKLFAMGMSEAPVLPRAPKIDPDFKKYLLTESQLADAIANLKPTATVGYVTPSYPEVASVVEVPAPVAQVASVVEAPVAKVATVVKAAKTEATPVVASIAEVQAPESVVPEAHAYTAPAKLHKVSHFSKAKKQDAVVSDVEMANWFAKNSR